MIPEPILHLALRIFGSNIWLDRSSGSGQLTDNLPTCLPSHPPEADSGSFQAFVPFTAAGQREIHLAGSLLFPDFQTANTKLSELLKQNLLSPKLQFYIIFHLSFSTENEPIIKLTFLEQIVEVSCLSCRT
jgi:hypothetical protein